jgi:hypothetical protein
MIIDQLSRDAALAAKLSVVCAPVHKRALGIAVGTTAGGLVFAVTAFHVLVHPAQGVNIELLSQYFYGYTVTWTGAVTGAFWGMGVGFVAGWFLAFVRNVCVAARLWWLSVGTDLANTHDFLDHI